MSKITKYDKNFLISQIAVVILCIFRVAKWDKYPHAARLKILDEYYLSIWMTLVMCVALFVLFMFTLKCIDTCNKNKAFYVIMLMSLMLYPTFVHDNYVGVMDIYVIITGALSMVFIISGKCEWITIPLMIIGTFIDPMGIFTIGLVIPIVLLYKGLVKGSVKHSVICLILCIAELATFFASRMMGMFALDAVDILDVKKFIIIMILLIPFIVVALIMFFNLIKQGATGTEKFYYIISALVGVPGCIVWAMSDDYTRAIVYLFICYGLWLLAMMSFADSHFTAQLQAQTTFINKYLPIPAIILIYIAAIMIYWMCGVEEVDVEQMLELVQ